LITGFNTDIRHNEKVYHIQTEDKGLQNPFIESLIYVGGEILASKKTSYAERIKEGIDDKLIGSLMEQQHKTMIAAIKRGRFDGLSESATSRTQISRATTVAQPSGAVVPPAPSSQPEKTLDQVIIDYLASEAESEHLEMSLQSSADFVAGHTTELRVLTRKSLSQAPIVDAAIEVRVISTIEPPRVIFRGTTGADGSVLARCNVPAFREGTAAVIISAHSPLGNDEVKQLVKRKK
jgi:hypothetical protein